MIKIRNYYITEYPKQNRVVIQLPQTAKSLTNTLHQISHRKFELSDEELSGILQLVISMYEGGSNYNKEFWGDDE